MSYSTCIKCDETVGMYQKYCSDCEKEYKQDINFWKNNMLKSNYNSSERELEIEEHLHRDRLQPTKEG